MSKRYNKSRSKSKSKQCGPGKILREGYHRKGYQRNEFERQDGTVVPATYVSAANVPPVCVKDTGRPGKGPKTLPKLGDKIHLTRYGYSIHKPESSRRAALRAASQDFNTLEVLRRLNLIRNYQAVPENKAIFSSDVEYMKKLYANIKKKDPANRQKGGVTVDEILEAINESDDSPITSDDSIDKIDLPETKTVEEKIDIIESKEICRDGKCINNSIVYEAHNVNGRQVVYYTLTEKDIEQILELDRAYINSDTERDSILEKIQNNPGQLIGIKVDDKLQGYCQFKPLANKEVKIVWFCANKGFGTPLYTFMEKYFKVNDYVRIKVIVKMEGSNAIKRINFWYDKGFQTYKTDTDKNQISMEKFI